MRSVQQCASGALWSGLGASVTQEHYEVCASVCFRSIIK